MDTMSKEMLEAFRILEEEKHINKEDIIDAVTESLKSAYKRRYGQSESCVIEFNEKKADFTVYTVREVVDEVFDSRLEISLKDALLAQRMNLVIRFALRNLLQNLDAWQLSQQNKLLWKKCVVKCVK